MRRWHHEVQQETPLERAAPINARGHRQHVLGRSCVPVRYCEVLQGLSGPGEQASARVLAEPGEERAVEGERTGEQVNQRDREDDRRGTTVEEHIDFERRENSEGGPEEEGHYVDDTSGQEYHERRFGPRIPYVTDGAGPGEQ